ncbi:MAG: NAD(P)/FAD-dependent oxidoreductase [Candidatus Micrarchaeota archaeon]
MKVKIIGAGPCGSIAAISALNAGHEIEVFEEHEKAGYPQHCSGLISKEALGSLSDFVDYKKYIINRINVALFDFGGESFEIRRKEETSFLINRAEFDYALAQKAESDGAKFFYGKKYIHNGADVGTNMCGGGTETQNSEPQAIIGADGAFSSIAHHFKFPKIEKFAFTLKTKIKTDITEKNKVFLFYDNKSFPGFFGWLIPHNEEEAEIGMGTLKPELMNKGFRDLIKKINAKFHKPKFSTNFSGKIIPLALRKKITYVSGKTNVLLVGDAAGQVKSSSGGGIVFGTAGARLAGLFVHAPHQYELVWKRENEKDVIAHMFLQNFFAFQPNCLLRLTAKVSKAFGLNHLLSLYGNMDRPTKILKPNRGEGFAPSKTG